MATMNCEVSIPKVEGLDDAQITVGRHLLLNCKNADTVGTFDFSKAQLKLAENETYKAKLFNVDASDMTQIKIDMTYYLVGSHSISQLVLTDAVNEVQLSGPEIKVESVLQAPTDGKPQEPFGPIAPIAISIPTLYFVSVLCLILLFIIYSVFKARRLAFYRRLKAKLVQYQTPGAPDTQFYKALRAAEKKDYPVEELEKAFRLYNLRAYGLPMFDLTNERVIRYFKRNNPRYKKTRISLQKFLAEFEELEKKKNELSPSDKNDFVKKMYRYVENNKGIES